jgi:predicted nucleic acid-binding protein
MGIAQERDSDTLIGDALGLSRDLTISLYDALYVALAKGLGYNFVTADRALYSRAEGVLPETHWIADVMRA